MGYVNINIRRIGISLLKFVWIGKNSILVLIVVLNKFNVYVVFDLCQDDCFVWLDIMLFEVFIFYF